MDPADFVTPHPTLISEVTPSLANQLMACQLRVAFARDADGRQWRRPSTYSVLGLVAHSVTEAAFRRQEWPREDGAIRTGLQDLWESEVERSAATLARAWAPANPPPPPEWPGYALTRARTIRRATKLLAERQSDQSYPVVGAGVEIELRDPGSGLLGRADRIDRDGSSTRVVDLKTGLHQNEPTEEQQRQLLMYAVLVHRTTGGWPESIAVEDASGLQHVLPLNPTEAESVLAEVESAVSSFNQTAATGDFVSTADPTAERCRWCSYRTVCQPFWESLTSDWEQRASLGIVAQTGTSEGGAFVTLLVESPTDSAGREVHISGLPTPLPTTVTKAAVVDWSGSSETGSVRARWSTTVRTW